MGSKGVLTGKLKNTFLEFGSDGEESDEGKRRPSSDPTTSRSSSWASWSESEESQSGRIYKFRGDLRQQARSSKVPNPREMPEQPKPKKKCTRPCKGKRERFRKYVDKVKSQVDQDPEGFDCDKLNLPDGLVQNDKGRKKVASIIENYRAGIISKGTDGRPSEGTNASGSEALPHNLYVISL